MFLFNSIQFPVSVWSLSMKPGSYFLRMRMLSECWRHKFTTNNSQQLPSALLTCEDRRKDVTSNSLRIRIRMKYEPGLRVRSFSFPGSTSVCGGFFLPGRTCADNYPRSSWKKKTHTGVDQGKLNERTLSWRSATIVNCRKIISYSEHVIGVPKRDFVRS